MKNIPIANWMKKTVAEILGMRRYDSSVMRITYAQGGRSDESYYYDFQGNIRKEWFYSTGWSGSLKELAKSMHSYNYDGRSWGEVSVSLKHKNSSLLRFQIYIRGGLDI
jgi:hypothetical protein